MILVDSNVLIDIFEIDDRWYPWSYAQLGDATERTRVVVTSVVIAEVAPAFETLEIFLGLLRDMSIEPLALSAHAADAAGRAYRQYAARRDEAPRLPLPDFFIGGQAQVLQASILTRDPRFYRRYFPTLTLITPETDHG